jgi:hypothetical protein
VLKSIPPFIVKYGVYPFDVLVCLGAERRKVVQKLNRLGVTLNHEEDEALSMHGLGRTVILEGGHSILWTRDVPRRGSGILAHEIFHAVSFLFSRIGMPLTEGSDEAYAYAIQFLTNEINKRIK